MGSAETDVLRERIAALERLLKDALAEVTRLQQDKDAVTRCKRPRSPIPDVAMS